MGYLNNTTRTLDAILTKRGREILSGGGSFNVRKFALGDDEIDYGLWDTTHTKGTDYYGAVIENLPALEPFNDPSEIMKYKLVTRKKGTKNMPFIRKSAGVLNIDDITVPYNPNQKYECDLPDGGKIYIGEPVNLPTWHTFLDPETTGTPVPEEWNISANSVLIESYSVTLLDVSVGILGPNIYTTGDNVDVTKFTSAVWAPISGKFLNEQKNLSQTIPNTSWSSSQLFAIGSPNSDRVMIYPKQTHTRYTSTDPIKTKLLVTGLTSGAVKEVNVHIHYQA
tara:strand:- start:239 stop:1081 length:843 start_codon:yes stop_codon:yes gene_type:complete